MANVYFFSPDGGTTRYPIEDTEARSRIAGQQNQLNAQGVLGAKNLLPYPYAQTTRTEQGITFTDNGDGTVTIGAGTATGNAYFTFANSSKNIKLDKGQYVISGGVSNNISFQFQLSARDIVDTGNGEHFSLDSDYTFVPGKATYIRVNSGTVISSPVTIKPMLRLASVPDDTYQPYAMTNRELTERVTPTYYASLTPVSDKITAGAMTLIVIGEICILNGWVTVSDNLVGNTVLYNLPSESGVNIEHDRRPFVTSVSQADSTKTLSLKVVQNQIKTDGNYNSAGTYTFNIIFTRT